MSKKYLLNGKVITASSKIEAKTIFDTSAKLSNMITNEMLEVAEEGYKGDADFKGMGTTAKFTRMFKVTNSCSSIEIIFIGSIKEDLNRSAIDVIMKIGQTTIYRYSFSGTNIEEKLEKGLTSMTSFLRAFKKM